MSQSYRAERFSEGWNLVQEKLNCDEKEQTISAEGLFQAYVSLQFFSSRINLQ